MIFCAVALLMCSALRIWSTLAVLMLMSCPLAVARAGCPAGAWHAAQVGWWDFPVGDHVHLLPIGQRGSHIERDEVSVGLRASGSLR